MKILVGHFTLKIILTLPGTPPKSCAWRIIDLNPVRGIWDRILLANIMIFLFVKDVFYKEIIVQVNDIGDESMQLGNEL